ncbi:hypothetical protein CWE17_11270 [Synechococcus sp. BS56D]|nr:hypothetical protein CWE17_11270 [Synechococcus sp. BS56D]
MSTTSSKHPPAFPQAILSRPAELVAPNLIGCLLVKRQDEGSLLWDVIVEAEAYSQEEPACHGYRRRGPHNETLLGKPGPFYVYVVFLPTPAVTSPEQAWKPLLATGLPEHAPVVKHDKA